MQSCLKVEKDEVTAETNFPSTLVSRNITIMGRRTSMRLEPAMWDALSEICRREKLTIHRLCDIILQRKLPISSLTAAIRVFTVSYFRAACTEEGHRKANHGSAFIFSDKKDFIWFMSPSTSSPTTDTQTH